MVLGFTTATRPENRAKWAKFEWNSELKLEETHGYGDKMESRAIVVNEDFSTKYFDWARANIPATQYVSPTARRKLDGKFHFV